MNGGSVMCRNEMEGGPAIDDASMTAWQMARKGWE